MTKNGNSLKPSRQLISSTKTKTMVASDFYLPHECWELVLKKLNHDKNNHCYFKSLSIVSKQFLSITNRLRFSLTIYFPTQYFLPLLFHRFTNLISLDLSCYYYHRDLDTLLRQISRFPLNLKSLNLSNQPIIPDVGLRDFSTKITTLTSLTCSNIVYIDSTDLFLIADCFPLLEELDLSHPMECGGNDSSFLEGIKALSMALFKLRKVNLSKNYYMFDESLFHLFKNCKLLEEAIIINCHKITNDGIASALRERPTLRSLSFSNTSGMATYTPCITSYFINSLVSLKGLTSLDLSSWHISDELLTSIAMGGLPLRRLVLQNCIGYSYAGIFSLLSKCQCIRHLDLQMAYFLNDQNVVELSVFLHDLVSINLSECTMLTESSLFLLVSKCLSLNEIKMEYTDIGKMSVKNSNSLMDCIVIPQLKSLYLARNLWLKDENIIMFASIFPNLQLLDLSNCPGISEESVSQVLRRCCTITHLNLANTNAVKLLRLNFEVPKLEVLNLSYTNVDDETLNMISKSCCRLLQLLLKRCNNVTEKGVEHVIKNCTQLREINLELCYKVDAKVVASMVISRPSLRKIIAPPRSRFNDKERKYFLHHGCLVC